MNWIDVQGHLIVTAGVARGPDQRMRPVCAVHGVIGENGPSFHTEVLARVVAEAHWTRAHELKDWIVIQEYDYDGYDSDTRWELVPKQITAEDALKASGFTAHSRTRWLVAELKDGMLYQFGARPIGEPYEFYSTDAQTAQIPPDA